MKIARRPKSYRRSIRACFRVVTFILLPLVTGGCRGTTTSDMMRHAIRRETENEEESVETTATPSKPQPSGETGTPPETTVAALPASTSPGDANAAVQDGKSSSSEGNSFDGRFASDDGSPASSPPQTPQERTERTIANLEAIGIGLNKYFLERGAYPPASISYAKRPLLSWRVLLLPYLGYQDLFRQFHLDEPWDGPHNRTLIARIPDIYRSPERWDEKTNYLAVTGSAFAFDLVQGKSRSEFEDGLHNCAILVEVDDDLAVPWTKPTDYEVDPRNVKRGLGQLRDGAFFIVWGGGTVGRIRVDAPSHQLLAMFTIASGETFIASDLHEDPLAQPEPGNKEGESPTVASSSATASPNTAGVTGSSSIEQHGDASASSNITNSSTRPRRPVPDQSTLNAAAKELTGIYAARLRTTSFSERASLLEEMLAHADHFADQPAHQYAQLSLAGRMAIEIGDIDAALQAASMLVEMFDVDELDLHAAIVRGTLRNESVASDKVATLARSCAERAFARDDYSLARDMVAAVSAVERHGFQFADAHAWLATKRKIDMGERMYRDVATSLRTLETRPDDGNANMRIGLYYCLLKDDMPRGLPFLLKSNDPALADIARNEIESPAMPTEQVELADAWWNYGERQRPWQRYCWLRAAHWYKQVVLGTDSGVAFVKADVRLKELARVGLATLP